MATAVTDTATAPVDLLAKFDPIIRTGEQLLAAGVEDPINLVLEQMLSPTRAICNGRDTILLGTYNYMGMTFDPDVIAAGKEAMESFGAGTTGSRVLNGTFRDHRYVDAAPREVYGMYHAMVFPPGHPANPCAQPLPHRLFFLYEPAARVSQPPVSQPPLDSPSGGR